MKKSQIQFHSDGFGRPAHPAVNVKCRHWPRASDIASRLSCTEGQADKASQFAYESACENFWEQIQDTAEYYLGKSVKVYSEGRSSGWLVIHDLPDVDGWDALRVSAWDRFAKAVAADIAYRCQLDTVCESIEANQWHKDGAELYNFVGDGVCIADMKQQAIAAGFAPVIRR